jgi:hypothetical protein
LARFETAAVGAALGFFASPAFAGPLQTPAPAIGAGIGAVLLVGVGYKAIKARIKP